MYIDVSFSIKPIHHLDYMIHYWFVVFYVFVCVGNWKMISDKVTATLLFIITLLFVIYCLKLSYIHHLIIHRVWICLKFIFNSFDKMCHCVYFIYHSKVSIQCGLCSLLDMPGEGHKLLFNKWLQVKYIICSCSHWWQPR